MKNWSYIAGSITLNRVLLTLICCSILQLLAGATIASILSLVQISLLILTFYAAKKQQLEVLEKFKNLVFHDIRSPLSMMQALVGIISYRGLTPDTLAFIKTNLPNIDETLNKLKIKLATTADPQGRKLPDQNFDAKSCEVNEFQLQEVNLALNERSAPIQILIVDDELPYINALKYQISMLFPTVQVKEARTREEVLLTLHSTKIDLVFLDLDIGSGYQNGILLLKQLKARYLHTKIAVHSNHSSPTIMDEVVAAGCDLFIPKPAKPSEILASVLTAM